MQDIEKQSISVGQWLRLPSDLRVYFKNKFNIPRSKGNHLDRGVLVSDGHTTQDLAVFTRKVLVDYVAAEKGQYEKAMRLSLDDLLEQAAIKAHKELYEPKSDTKEEDSTEIKDGITDTGTARTDDETTTGKAVKRTGGAKKKSGVSTSKD